MASAKRLAIEARTAARKAAGLIPDYSRHARRPGETAPKRARVALPCVYRGTPTGETRPCQGCGGKLVPVPLLACDIYGVCTVGRSVKLADGTPVRPCSDLCPSYVPRPQM
jgi:hypothetical protein